MKGKSMYKKGKKDKEKKSAITFTSSRAIR
jgi:hypothetical protein